MRRYRSALILLLILALMSGGYYFYTYVWPMLNTAAEVEDGPVEAPSEMISLIDREMDELAELRVNYLSEEYIVAKEIIMEKTGESGAEQEVTHWRLANLEDFRADSSKLSAIASNFCVFTSSKLVEENAADLAQYGFGGPNSALAVGVFSDGAEMTLEIGDKNPTNDAYYIRRNNENTVYLGSTYSAEKIKIKKTDIVELKLFALKEDDISRIEMMRGGAPLFTAINKGESSWELEQPLIATFNTTAQGQLIESVADVSASEFVEFDVEDLPQYGLDKPRYSLLFELSDGSGDAELIIGNEKAVRSSVYAMLGGTSDVFVLNLANFGYLDKPIKEFIDSFVYIVSIDKVNHIQADFDDLTIRCDISADLGNSENDAFLVNGVDVTKLENESGRSLFRLFYQALIGVTIYDIELDSEPEGDAEISFSYELKEEPFSMLVEFVPKDERLYYVFRNKVYAGVLVEKRLFDKDDEGLRPTYAQLAAAMDS